MIGDTGTLERRVTYTPYGEARHHWHNDVDGDGEVSAADTTAASNANGNSIHQSGYNVDADFNRDGVVNSTDTAQVTSSSYKGALPGGWIAPLPATGKGTIHTIGYCGYMLNREVDGSGGLYTVRFRHYDPVWGRWLQRDPAGYMDSMSLYGYGWGSPMTWSDPFGLTYRWYNPFTWTDPSEEDEEWQRMIDRNLEMRRQKLAALRDKGSVSQREWYWLDLFMTSSVSSAKIQLQLIYDHAGMLQLQAAKNIAILGAGGIVFGWVYHAIRAYVAGGTTVYFVWLNGTLYYRIGKSGPWLFASGGKVHPAVYQIAAGTRGVPIPIIYEGAAGTAGNLGAKAASNCVFQGGRVIGRGWGWPPRMY